MLTLHAENTKYNTVFSKSYQKRGSGLIELYFGDEVYLLEPDELIEKLKAAGIKISRKTLYNWEKRGLIPKAIFRNSRQTIYPDHAFTEALASGRIKNGDGARVDKISQARELALKCEQSDAEIYNLMTGGAFGTIVVDEDGSEYIKSVGNFEKAMAATWLRYKFIAASGFDPGDANVNFFIMKKQKTTPGEPDKYIIDVRKD